MADQLDSLNLCGGAKKGSIPSFKMLDLSSQKSYRNGSAFVPAACFDSGFESNCYGRRGFRWFQLLSPSLAGRIESDGVLRFFEGSGMPSESRVASIGSQFQ